MLTQTLDPSNGDPVLRIWCVIPTETGGGRAQTLPALMCLHCFTYLGSTDFTSDTGFCRGLWVYDTMETTTMPRKVPQPFVALITRIFIAGGATLNPLPHHSRCPIQTQSKGRVKRPSSSQTTPMTSKTLRPSNFPPNRVADLLDGSGSLKSEDS